LLQKARSFILQVSDFLVVRLLDKQRIAFEPDAGNGDAERPGVDAAHRPPRVEPGRDDPVVEAARADKEGVVVPAPLAEVRVVMLCPQYAL
jgi:hypothetical protein